MKTSWQKVTWLTTLCGCVWVAATSAAETQKYWLNPQSLPEWAQTGQFRCSRWDGGPLEAEKGRLSGWPMWDEGDPQGILGAVRQFYDLKTIAWAKRAGLNWVWVTWSVGFSHETERPHWDLVRTYIAECHKQGIHVTAYISGANIFQADMLEHVPDSRNWWELDKTGKPISYSAATYGKYGITRYMANVHHPQWLPYQRVRIHEALAAGADGFWVDNIGTSKHERDIQELVDVIMEEGKAVGRVPVVCFNMHKGSLAVARYMNALSTEDGVEPGYFPNESASNPTTPNKFSAHEADAPAESAGLVCNLGLLKYEHAVSEGWRASAIEYGRRHAGGSRMVDIMPPDTWQLALAECQSHHTSLEPYFEGVLMRDLTQNKEPAVACLEAMGNYNRFFAQHAAYLSHPRSLARVAILSETGAHTSEQKVISFLNQLAACRLQCDAFLDVDAPALDNYDVVILPDFTDPNNTWKEALDKWMAKGGTVLTWGDAAKQLEQLGFPGGKTARTLLDEGRIIVISRAPNAEQVAARLKDLVAAHEAVTLKAPPYVLLNAVRQEAEKRTIIHILNYQKQPCPSIELACAKGGKTAQVLSPDCPQPSTVVGASANGKTVFQLPPVKIYSLVVIPD